MIGSGFKIGVLSASAVVLGMGYYGPHKAKHDSINERVAAAGKKIETGPASEKYELKLYGWSHDADAGECGHSAVAIIRDNKVVGHLGYWPSTWVGGCPLSVICAEQPSTTKSLKSDIIREGRDPDAILTYPITTKSALRAIEHMKIFHSEVEKGELRYGLLPVVGQPIYSAFTLATGMASPEYKPVENCTTVVHRVCQSAGIFSPEETVIMFPASLISAAAERIKE